MVLLNVQYVARSFFIIHNRFIRYLWVVGLKHIVAIHVGERMAEIVVNLVEDRSIGDVYDGINRN